MRQTHLGKYHTPETKKKMRRAHLGKHHSAQTIEKLRQVRGTPEAREKMRRHYENPEYLKNWSAGLHSKTKPEKHLQDLLQSLYPNEFKYNGRYDCGISIDGLIPDFINVNGRKQIIDMHGSYWHKDEDVKGRQERYAKYGYFSLIIWDYELKNEKEVIQKIIEFVHTGGCS